MLMLSSLVSSFSGFRVGVIMASFQFSFLPDRYIKLKECILMTHCDALLLLNTSDPFLVQIFHILDVLNLILFY